MSKQHSPFLTFLSSFLVTAVTSGQKGGGEAAEDTWRSPKAPALAHALFFCFMGSYLTTPSSRLRKSDWPCFKAHQHNPSPSGSACQSHQSSSMPVSAVLLPAVPPCNWEREKQRNAPRSSPVTRSRPETDSPAEEAGILPGSYDTYWSAHKIPIWIWKWPEQDKMLLGRTSTCNVTVSKTRQAAAPFYKSG